MALSVEGYRVSNSKIKTWRRCPKRFEYKYVFGLNPKKRELALERGSWIHELLQTYYDGEDWLAIHKALSKQFYNMFEEEREDLGDLPTECLRIMRSYLRHYKDDLTRYRVVDSELDEVVTLPNGIEVNIIVDLIMEDTATGKLWPWDHKTRKNFADTDSMLLDPQLTIYYWGLEHMGYTPLGGSAYNEICTKPPTVPKLLKNGELSQAKSIATDLYTYAAEIKRHDLDIDDYRDILRHIAVTQRGRFFNRVFLPKDPPVIKTMMKELVDSVEEMVVAEHKQRFPRTFIPQSCKWDCSYKDICITQLHGGDIDQMVKMNFETRDQRRKREIRERRRRAKLRG